MTGDAAMNVKKKMNGHANRAAAIAQGLERIKVARDRLARTNTFDPNFAAAINELTDARVAMDELKGREEEGS
jgi:hypothetical protein